LIKVIEAHQKDKGAWGVDVYTGEALAADTAHVYDNYIVKR